MPKRELLTDRSVNRFRAPAQGERYLIFDTVIKELCCKVACGAKTGRVKKSLGLTARFPGSIHADERGAAAGNRLNSSFRLIAEHGTMSMEEIRKVAQQWLLD